MNATVAIIHDDREDHSSRLSIEFLHVETPNSHQASWVWLRIRGEKLLKSIKTIGSPLERQNLIKTAGERKMKFQVEFCKAPNVFLSRAPAIYSPCQKTSSFFFFGGGDQ